MSDEPVPFPAAEANGDKKPRRRRGGVRRRKPRAGAEETRPALEPAPAAPPVIAAIAPSPAPTASRDAGAAVSSASHSISASPLLPARSSVEQRLCIFIDFENIALGVRDAQYKKFDIHLVLQRLIEKGRIV